MSAATENLRQPDESRSSTAIFVLGMHRGGTSALAGAAACLGVHLGTKLIPATADNEKGHWEHAEIVELHNRLLLAFGRSWQATQPLPPQWWQRPEVEPFRRDLRDVVRRDLDSAALWGVKDPRLCRLMPLWWPILEDCGRAPGFVLILRDPYEVAASLERRDGLAWNKSLLLYADHLLCAEQYTRGHRRAVVTYEELLANGPAALARVARELDLSWPRDPADAHSELGKLLDPHLRHHAKGQDKSADGIDEALAGVAVATFEALGALQRAPEEDVASRFQELRADLERMRQRLGGWLDRSIAGARYQHELEDLVRKQQTELQKQQIELQKQRAELQKTSDVVQELEAELAHREAELTAIRSSLSWRVTAPLRRAYSALLTLRHTGDLRLVRRSTLFDAEWYTRQYQDVATSGVDPARHYLEQGWREGRDPGPGFSTRRYLEIYPDVRQAGVNPLVHYLRHGRREGRLTGADPSGSASETRRSRLAELARFLSLTAREPRMLPARIRLAYSLLRHQGPRALAQALDQALRATRFQARLPSSGRSPRPAADDRYYENYQHALATARAKTGKDYVPDDALDVSDRDLPVTLVAFYLPQFHPIPENDRWWGPGFTEWTNVSKAVPQFLGHYQPHFPGELGFYDLRLPEVQRRQAALAKKYGIRAFCFYYYWFDGKVVLDRPLKQFVADPEIDLSFCLCWANENWTRRWDGLEQEILLAQKHSLEGDSRMIDDVVSLLAHPRYLRIGERPVLLVYRAHHLSDPAAVSERWRETCARHGLPPPFLLAVESFGFAGDPRRIGFDGLVEFPPLSVLASLAPARAELQFLNPQFRGRVFDYAELVDRMLARQRPDYPFFRTAMPGWDNTPRRRDEPTIFVNSTPALYHRLLSGLIRDTCEHAPPGERLVFINAWNEWAEGNHLEPDRRFGYAFLRATRQAVVDPDAEFPEPSSASPKASWRILFVSHDAQRAGAQLVLLTLVRWLKQHTRLDLALLCLQGGPLLPAFQSLLPTAVLPSDATEAEVRQTVSSLLPAGPDLVYGNTVVAARIYPALAPLNAPIVTHVHELGSSIREYAADAVDQAVAHSSAFIAVSSAVARHLREVYGVPPARCFLAHAFVPSETLRTPELSDRRALRDQLGLDREAFVVVGCGLGMPFRKGADLFIEVGAAVLEQTTASVKFYWVGGFDPAARDPEHGSWAAHLRKLRNRRLREHIRFLGFRDRPQDYFAAADLFLLTSREDPFPLVMMEAAAAGLPIVCFDDSGGGPEFGGSSAGSVVPHGDTAAMAREVVALLSDNSRRLALGRGARQRAAEFTADRVCPRILSVAREVAKQPPKVTVIVPNFNHARYLPERLRTVFQQTFRDIEVILMDDASTDGSAAILRQWADYGDTRLIINDENSGSPFKQWVKALPMARGDVIWIAESDDLADLEFLETLLPAFEDPDVRLAYCPSRVIDTEGRVVGDYREMDYLKKLSPRKWLQSYCVSAEQEVNEALGVKNSVLNISSALFRRLAWDDEFLHTLGRMRVGGDWFLILNVIRGGKIAYDPRVLNYHRRHSESVVGEILSGRRRAQAESLFRDYAINLRYVVENFDLTPEFFARLNDYLGELTAQFGDLGDAWENIRKHLPEKAAGVIEEGMRRRGALSAAI